MFTESVPNQRGAISFGLEGRTVGRLQQFLIQNHLNGFHNFDCTPQYSPQSRAGGRRRLQYARLPAKHPIDVTLKGVSEAPNEMATVAAAAAALRRKKLQSQAVCGVVQVTKEEFLRVIALEPEPLIVRSAKTKFWSSEHTGASRYLAAVRGLTFFVDFTEEFDVPENCIVIESEKITVFKDL